MIAGDYYYYFFSHQKGAILFEGRRLFKGDDYFKYCSLEVVPKIFCFIISSNQKIITSNKLNILWANFKCSKLNMLPRLIFRAWILTDQFCWINLHFNLTGRGLKKRRWQEGWGGGVQCLMEEFDRGTAIIQEIWYYDCPYKIPPSDIGTPSPV